MSKMEEVALVFPHQLFDLHPAFSEDRSIFLIEEPIFFQGITGRMKIHKKKLMFHRSTMQAYRDRLLTKGYIVNYLMYQQDLFEALKHEDVLKIYIADTVDHILENKVSKIAKMLKAELNVLESPGFLTPIDWMEEFFQGATHFSQTKFYIAQRKRLKILLDKEGHPIGGKWSFDAENRKKLPHDIRIQDPPKFETSKYIQEAKNYVECNFSDHPGSTQNFQYPITHEQADFWFHQFLKTRLHQFGDYQDAISKNDSFLFHSQLSPLLNIGLLSPGQVVDNTLRYSLDYEIPLNSLEGFLRQIIGWREFMRAVYVLEGKQEHEENSWGHIRQLPASFYSASTAIEPIDRSIRRLLSTSYLNHIERLMILGNFMLLCEINPHEVYRWFMEMFIDAYDWVMVPNVYGMSQYADGGKITTKPYISSSSYILRMSDYEKGDWCKIWDGLYWRFLYKHIDYLSKNPRMGLAVRNLDRMDKRKLEDHLAIAEKFLQGLQ